MKAYEAVVKGKNIPRPGLPESFKVLIKELQSVGLDIRVLDADKNEIQIKELEDEDVPQERTIAPAAAEDREEGLDEEPVAIDDADFEIPDDDLDDDNLSLDDDLDLSMDGDDLDDLGFDDDPIGDDTDDDL